MIIILIFDNAFRLNICVEIYLNCNMRKAIGVIVDCDALKSF